MVRRYSTDTVAQHTLALLLHLVEKNTKYDSYVESKEYAMSGRLVILMMFSDIFINDLGVLV